MNETRTELDATVAAGERDGSLVIFCDDAPAMRDARGFVAQRAHHVPRARELQLGNLCRGVAHAVRVPDDDQSDEQHRK